METCNICIEDYKGYNIKITCQCNFSACKNCIVKYAYQENSVKCLSCKNIFSRKFIAEKFPKSFMLKDYKLIRENFLFEQELGFIQGTIELMEKEKVMEEMRKELRELTDIKINFEYLLFREKSKELIEKHLPLEFVNTFKKELTYITQKVKDIKMNLNIKEVKKIEFLCQCPNKNCNGLVKKENKLCSVCEIKVCKKCFEIKTKEHQCNEETLESIKIIKKFNTKPCPKCFTSISKISGCDQMFCINCKTAFSWRTLQIETGVMHNPHYFELLRSGKLNVNHDNLQ